MPRYRKLLNRAPIAQFHLRYHWNFPRAGDSAKQRAITPIANRALYRARSSLCSLCATSALPSATLGSAALMDRQGAGKSSAHYASCVLVIPTLTRISRRPFGGTVDRCRTGLAARLAQRVSRARSTKTAGRALTHQRARQGLWQPIAPTQRQHAPSACGVRVSFATFRLIDHMIDDHRKRVFARVANQVFHSVEAVRRSRNVCLDRSFLGRPPLFSQRDPGGGNSGRSPINRPSRSPHGGARQHFCRCVAAPRGVLHRQSEQRGSVR
jgi:hypothetical protein